MHDVIVVGAGPVGSRVAEQLARLGHGVVVVDRKTDVGVPVCCTGIVSEECVGAFAIDGGVIYRQASGGQVLSPSGSAIALYRNSSQAAVLNRPGFNSLMARRAADRGAQYILGARVFDLRLQPGCVDVTYARELAQERLSARAVVIATGFRQELITKAGLRRSADVVGGAQAEIDVAALEDIRVYLGSRFAPGFFAWLVPTAGGKALAGLLSRKAPGQRLRAFLSFLAGQNRSISRDARIAVSAVTLKPPERTCTDRILVVGTAAGQVKPITGGGIYYGLLCADIAAQTLDAGLRLDALSQKHLSGYQHAWKALLGDELRTAYRARRLYERLSDGRIDRILDTMSSSGLLKRALASNGVSFDWHGRSIRHLLTLSSLAKLIGGM